MLFDLAFDRVFSNEGGYQNDPADRGNWTGGQVGVGINKGTKYGISAMTYPDLDIENLSHSQAKSIYRRDWWDSMGMASMPAALAYQLFDAAINHGLGQATKMLQRAAGVVDDGHIGPITRAAIESSDQNDLLLRFLAGRLEFMTHIATWPLYGKGWALRIAHNLRYAAQDN